MQQQCPSGACRLVVSSAVCLEQEGSFGSWCHHHAAFLVSMHTRLGAPSCQEGGGSSVSRALCSRHLFQFSQKEYLVQTDPENSRACLGCPWVTPLGVVGAVKVC